MCNISDLKSRIRELEKCEVRHTKSGLPEYNFLLQQLRELGEYSVLPKDKLEMLKSVPIDAEVLSYMGDYRVLCAKFEGRYIHLDELFDIDQISFMSIPTCGKRLWFKFVEFRDKLAERFDDFMTYYTCCYSDVTLSMPDDGKVLPLYERFDKVFAMLCNKIKEIGAYKKKLSDVPKVMMRVLRNEQPYDEKRSDEAIRLIRESYIYQIRRGYLDCAPNVSIDPDLIAEIKTFEKSGPKYKSMAYVNEKMGGDGLDSSMLRFFLRLQKTYEEGNTGQSYCAFDQPYYLSKDDSVRDLQTYVNFMYKALTGTKADIRPQSLQQITDSIAELKPDFDFDEDVIAELVEQNTWIMRKEVDGEMRYYIRYSVLKDYQKFGRIIYEYKNVTVAEAEAIDKRLSDGGETIKNFTVTWNVTKKHYPWATTGGQAGVYVYNEHGTVIPQMITVIRDFAMEKKMFRFNEVIDHLHRLKWYKVVKESSVRTYILKWCQPSNEDKDLFCHSEYTGDYTMHTWRSRTEQGFSNWVVSKVIGYLNADVSHSMNYKAVLKCLKTDAKKEEKTFNVSNAKSLLQRLACEDGIMKFSEKGDTIALTPKGMELTDIEIAKLGVRDRMPEYYKEVVATIQSALRKENGGIMLMKNVKKVCEDALERDLGTAFYKIVTKYLPEQIVKVHKDGDAYLKLIEEKIEYAPQMVIDTKQADDSEITAPTLVSTQTAGVAAPGVRENFNWDALSMSMETQLEYYGRWWINGVSMKDSIAKFREFIEHVSNLRLQKSIPQFMYEFWHCKNDELDYFHYMSELCVCYEQLLSFINLRNEGELLGGNGLVERVSMMPEVKKWVETRAYPYEGFIKIYNTLRHVRNVLSHGEDPGETLVSMIQKISSFIALYVYTVARFVK